MILSSEGEERMRKQETRFKGRMKGGGNRGRWENDRKEEAKKVNEGERAGERKWQGGRG